MPPWRTARAKSTLDEVGITSPPSNCGREQRLCARTWICWIVVETNLYRLTRFIAAQPETSSADRSVHRCYLARSWLNRYGFPASHSRPLLFVAGSARPDFDLFRSWQRPMQRYGSRTSLSRLSGVGACRRYRGTGIRDVAETRNSRNRLPMAVRSTCSLPIHGNLLEGS